MHNFIQVENKVEIVNVIEILSTDSCMHRTSLTINLREIWLK
jgi:hypothetical protein